jgi:hypothetical protein
MVKEAVAAEVIRTATDGVVEQEDGDGRRRLKEFAKRVIC